MIDALVSSLKAKWKNRDLQGILLKRHKIPGFSGHQLAPKEIQVGQTVTVYGRTYYIAAVDAFTRHYLAEHGIQLAPDEQIPACPYDAWLAAHNAPGEHGPSHLFIEAHFASFSRILAVAYGQQSSVETQGKTLW